MIHITLILLIILCGSPSFAQIYKWVDEHGGVHYADDVTSVPEKYQRSMMKVDGVDLEQGRGRNESRPSNKEDNYRDRLGRGEDYWKGRVTESKDRMKSLQEKGENLRLKYNELSTKFNESRSSVERAGLRNERDQIKREMDKIKEEIEEVKNTLDKKIPEEAEFYKAKPEWTK
jgi:predicted  nucleic acid-binding Zn-ribbon protein